jgi:putative transposase
VAPVPRNRASGILACGFPHAGTVLPWRVHVLFVLEIGGRAVRVLGVTAYPAGSRTARRARSLLMDPGGRAGRFGFLVRDRDGRFSGAFGEVVAGNGTGVIKTPVRSRRASAFAERFAGTLGRECPGRLLVLGERRLRGVLAGYARHCNGRRPHQGLRQEPPLHRPGRVAGVAARLGRRQVLDG